MDTKAMLLIYILLIVMVYRGSCVYHESDDVGDGLLARVEDYIKRSSIQKREAVRRGSDLDTKVQKRKKRFFGMWWGSSRPDLDKLFG